ncbi:pancreatic secretory granule membrane major glycoprotein GP2-like [Rana temporaria]|uniref:pancreatic secretory granule membrane major glycoprotein GP2-like n=1 Tax=Rana temporaria TaxID=8407 RepID=UPI001AAC74B6|nr:pancreatic secretory granule membrane major glycoprotein GP2-like [Rana temporaria]
MKVFIFIIVGIITKQVSAVDPECYAGSDPPLCDDAACGGTCDAFNGCNCNNGVKCFPSNCILDSNDCCDVDSGWYYDSTKPCCTKTFQCNPRCASDEVCVESNGLPDCPCNVTVYKDKVIGDFKPSVSCAGSTMTTSFSKCELQALGYNFSSVHLFNTSEICVYPYPEIQNGIRMTFVQVAALVGWCGNIDTVGSSDIYFTNNLYIEANSGPLITKNPITYNFSCVFNRTMQTSLNFFLNPISSTITIPPQNGISSYTVTLAAYSDETCTLPLQGSNTLTVGTILYLGIFSPDLNGDAFSLRAEKCYATPTNDSNSNLNVILVDGGCAADGSVATTVLENGVSTEARIQISSFLFQGYNDIFIYCSVTICNKSEDCTKCNSVSARAADTISPVISIKLNLEDLNNIEYTNSGHVKGVSWALLVSTLLAYFYVKPF